MKFIKLLCIFSLFFSTTLSAQSTDNEGDTQAFFAASCSVTSAAALSFGTALANNDTASGDVVWTSNSEAATLAYTFSELTNTEADGSFTVGDNASETVTEISEDTIQTTSAAKAKLSGGADLSAGDYTGNYTATVTCTADDTDR